MAKVNRYISPKWENKSFSMYLVYDGRESGGENGVGGNKCIYLHQHSIKKIKQHVLEGKGDG